MVVEEIMGESNSGSKTGSRNGSAGQPQDSTTSLTQEEDDDYVQDSTFSSGLIKTILQQYCQNEDSAQD